MFLGRMVMKTLSPHVSLLKTGQESKGVVSLASTKPYGALMISIQAVCILKFLTMFSHWYMDNLGSTCAHVCEIR